MKPQLLIATILGGMSGVLVELLFDAGLRSARKPRITPSIWAGGALLMRKMIEPGAAGERRPASKSSPGLGVLIGYMIFGKGMARGSAPAAAIIHTFGGIHERGTAGCPAGSGCRG
jgi:mannitol-specific phosphotransferase system IIBC component